MQAPSINLMSWKTQKQCLNDDNQHAWEFDKKQQPTKDMVLLPACHSSQHWPRKQMTKKNICWHHSLLCSCDWESLLSSSSHFMLDFANFLFDCWVHWLSLCKQSCVIRLLLCFENHHACLVSSWADIVTVTAFWANLFLWLLFWRCFDSQLAGAIVIMLVSKTANFTLFSLFLLTGGFPDL
mgnify:CR=1 FL=1